MIDSGKIEVRTNDRLIAISNATDWRVDRHGNLIVFDRRGKTLATFSPWGWAQVQRKA